MRNAGCFMSVFLGVLLFALGEIWAGSSLDSAAEKKPLPVIHPFVRALPGAKVGFAKAQQQAPRTRQRCVVRPKGRSGKKRKRSASGHSRVKKSVSTDSFFRRLKLPKFEDIERTEAKISYVQVLPDVTTPVVLSSTDVNRVVCPYDVTDVIFSNEKNFAGEKDLLKKVVGKNVFLKFRVKKVVEKKIPAETASGSVQANRAQVLEKSIKLVYATKPVGIYIICGKNVYSIIAYPRKVPPVTVLLSPGKEDRVKKNIALFSRTTLEKAIAALIKRAYTGSFDEAEQKPMTGKRSVFVLPEGVLKGKRVIRVEGVGMVVKEYEFTAAHSEKIDESLFLVPEIVEKPLAVAVDKLKLGKGEKARVFIVEKTI